MPRELSVTSYAILGLLAMRDWSAYDMTKEMQRNLVYFWPRAESAIYVEVKRLKEAGFATARAEPNGRRPRTIYAITSHGRDALRAWLSEPAGRGAQLESEGLLRLQVAGAMPPDPATVLSALDAFEREANAWIQTGLVVGRDFLDGDHPFQDQLRWRAHIYYFTARYALLIAEWVQQTRALVATWDHDDERAIDRDALALVAEMRELLLAATPKPEPTPQVTMTKESDDTPS